MRLSTSTNIYSHDLGKPYQIEAEDSIRVCRQAGYHFLDANLCGMCRPGKKVSPLTQDNWEQQVIGWRKLADEEGITFRQAHAFWSLNSPVDKNELPDGSFGEEMMRRSVIAAQILGVEWMVVHPISISVNGVISSEESMRYNLDYFGRWHSFYHDHGIGMAIENMVRNKNRNNPWGDVDLLIALVDQLNSPDIGTCLDTGHAYLSGYKPEDCVLQMGARLKATHIADNHGRDVDEHILPFSGTISWVNVMRALRQIGYENDFSFEVHRLTAGYPIALQKDLIQFSYKLGQYLLSEDFSAHNLTNISL